MVRVLIMLLLSMISIIALLINIPYQKSIQTHSTVKTDFEPVVVEVINYSDVFSHPSMR
ncbi:hypothetical protein DFP78_101361 [Photobacterium lutimaris]|nr:hypothetical protein DFP78_101361 [Photobacterium lutimaris]